MEPFYAVEGLQWGKSNTINRTADSNISVTIVPAGEVYFLRSVGVVLDNNPAVAGEGGHYSVHLTNIPTSNQPLTQHPIAYLGSFFGGSTTALSLSVEFPKLIPISANSSIWFMLDGSNFTGAGNVNIKTCYSYYREFA